MRKFKAGNEVFLAPATVIEVFASDRGRRGQWWDDRTCAALSAKTLTVKKTNAQK